MNIIDDVQLISNLTIYNMIRNSFSFHFAITLCETQLSAEDRSFVPYFSFFLDTNSCIPQSLLGTPWEQ